jgi:hypothetical protein
MACRSAADSQPIGRRFSVITPAPKIRMTRNSDGMISYHDTCFSNGVARLALLVYWWVEHLKQFRPLILH